MSRIAVILMILAALAAAPVAAEDEWNGVERIVAIGDVHGDYGQFLSLLQQAGLTNRKGKWTGGKTHFVQTGDLPDRGPDTRKILDLMMRLEKQAKKAGGRVHALIGNHDAMNVYGDLRYVTPEEFKAFQSGNSRQIRDAFWDQYREELEARGETPDDVAKKKWYDQRPLGFFEHRLAWGPKGRYGKWVMEHNVVIKINETLFVHGGISPRLANSSLAEINQTVREELADRSRLEGGLTLASDGPLWYRGLATGSEQELAPHVEAVLEHYGVKRIAIGHTPSVGTVIPRFGGKVLMIDVGLAAHYGGRMACLVIENGTPYTLHRGTRLDLPAAGTRDALLAYLKAAAALDPEPSPLQATVQQLEQGAAVAASDGDDEM